MEMLSIEQELRGNSYPGRGIIIGKSADGKKAVTAYFIMGRSENSRNRVFVTVSYTHLSNGAMTVDEWQEQLVDVWAQCAEALPE